MKLGMILSSNLFVSVPLAMAELIKRPIPAIGVPGEKDPLLIISEEIASPAELDHAADIIGNNDPVGLALVNWHEPALRLLDPKDERIVSGVLLRTHESEAFIIVQVELGVVLVVGGPDFEDVYYNKLNSTQLLVVGEA